MDTFLVEPDWLEEKLGSSGLLVLDCSWSVPEANHDARTAFESAHVPTAAFFDLNIIADFSRDLINMLPDAATFESEVGKLGIDNDTMVVIYDSGYVSARVWWMFKHFGHENVRVLNGGLRRWEAEGRPLVSGPSENETRAFSVTGTVDDVVEWQGVLAALDDPRTVIVDARTPERFTGEASSGYVGIPGGHMPGAINVSWRAMINQDGDFSFLPPDAARALFENAGVDLDRPVIATCGSGITAAVLAFQLQRIGHTNWKIYDGSWYEWAQRDDLPKAIG